MSFMAPHQREFEEAGNQIHIATPFHAKDPVLYINYKNFCSATWREKIHFKYQLLAAFALILWNHKPNFSAIVREEAEKQFGKQFELMPRVVARNHFLRAFPQYILRDPRKFQHAHPKEYAMMKSIASRITPTPRIALPKAA